MLEQKYHTQETVYQPTPKERFSVSPEKARELFNRMHDVGTKYNWVIASMNGDAGAGHDRQALHFIEGFAEAGLAHNTTWISMPYPRTVFSRTYRTFQNIPRLYDKAGRYIDEHPKTIAKIKSRLKKPANAQELLHRVQRETATYDENRPTVIIATHPEQEEAAIDLINAGQLENAIGVISALPDPNVGGSMVIMSADTILQKGKHYVLTHDVRSASEYTDTHTDSHAVVFPLGTASDPFFLLYEQQRTPGPLHIGVELSGGRTPKYEERIKQFISSVADPLRNNEIRATIHTMHHTVPAAEFRDLLDGLSITQNVRVIAADTERQAIESRKLYIRGMLTDWPAPDVVIGKGEVPVEYRGNQLIVCPWGGGHEGKLIDAGVREGRAVDYRNMKPDTWYPNILQDLTMQKSRMQDIPQSLAVFAPLLIDDPQTFEKLGIFSV